MTIRKATKKDIPRILELFNSDPNLVGVDNFLFKRKHILEFVTHPINNIFVYEMDKIILGVIQAEFWKTSKLVSLNEIVVDKKYQGKKIGFKLIKYLEELAKKRGMEFLYLFSEEDNKKAHQLFKKGGYEKGKKFTFFSKKI